MLFPRLSKVQPSLTLAITARAKAMKDEGIDVISFGAGEPDFDTPTPIVEAAQKALATGVTKYTPVAGLPKLRSEIARWYEENYGVSVKPEEVIVGTGGKQILYNAMMVLCSEGDKVLIPSPYWLSYPAMANLADAEPVFIETTEENGFLITPEQLKSAMELYRPRILVLNSPANPTSQAYNEAELKALAEVLRQYPETYIIWDNIYSQLTYGDFEHKELALVAPDLKKRIICCGGFSKSFAMTGWRLGFGIACVEIIKAMTTIQSHSTSNPTSFSQAGAIAALSLDPHYQKDMLDAFAHRREVIMECIEKLPNVSCVKPKGAFYALVNMKAYCHVINEQFSIVDDITLSEAILNHAHVAVVPGSAFGASGYIRLSFATSEELIREGLSRIGKFLETLR